MNNSPERCRNCNALLSGEYCSKCGQREGRPDIELSDAAGEVLGDIVSWDSRLWRTLFALLFKPGFLTAEFMAGRKARYVPPFRLYLMISFLLFLLLSLGSEVLVVGQPEQSVATADEPLDPNSGTIIDTTAEDGAGIVVQGMEEPAADADADADIAIILGNPEGSMEDSRRATISVDFADENSPRWQQELQRRMEDNAEDLRENPGAFIELLIEYLPQMMFLLLPLFALLLKICYLFSPFHYLQHLVFSLYYHSFAYLLYLFGLLVERFAVHFDGVMFLLFLIYLPVALWRAYGSGIGGSLGKSAFIFVCYSFLLLLGFAAITVLALAFM